MPIDPIEAAFRAGFTAGFTASQEGFNGECAFEHLSGVDAASVDDALDKLANQAWGRTKPCDCGCGKFGPGGHMEAVHPEDYKYDERA